jgi:HAD superfamily phosphoserine phosphatase-like hydrolase
MIDVFDFDHTVYDGDVSLDFYFYSLRKHPSILRYLPGQLWHAFLYLASVNSRTKFKQEFFGFLKGLHDIDVDIKKFWQSHEKNIKPWYSARKHNKDIIISASPEFIIEPMAKKLGTRRLIATRMDKITGSIEGRNCRGVEKVKRLRSEIDNIQINECYSDSLSDLPLLKLAKEKYIVKKHAIIPFDEYRPSQFKQKFFRKSFLTFIFVGGINAFIGLSFASIASFFIQNHTVAFMIGYCTGLVPSYFLNSTMTFHNYNYSVKAFIKYCISYIPNLLVQTLCVGILIELLSVNTFIAYLTAVIVGVPVTFLIVSVFAIKNKEVE